MAWVVFGVAAAVIVGVAVALGAWRFTEWIAMRQRARTNLRILTQHRPPLPRATAIR